MSRFLYVWELGTNLGHVGGFEPFASVLATGGHDVILAVRETEPCARLLGGRFKWLQAPVVSERQIRGSPLNYADILLRFGYDDPIRLRGLLVAWQEMMRSVQPELVLADHAPTAILAARTLELPVMLLGTGFCCPPQRDPLPGMRPWELVADDILAKRDAIALSTINTVLDCLKTERLERLSDLFDVEENAILTLPELDHYPNRGLARYWGSIHSFSGTRSRHPWPPGEGKRLFGYLRIEHPHFRQVLQAVGSAGSPAIMYVPNWSFEEPVPPNVLVIIEPTDMQVMTAEADLAIVHGGTTTTAFLMAGKPVLCLPTQLEQYLLGLRIASLGTGLLINPEHHNPDIVGALARMLGDDSFALNAKAFANKYAFLDQATVIKNIAKRAEEIVSGTRRMRSKWPV